MRVEILERLQSVRGGITRRPYRVELRSKRRRLFPEGDQISAAVYDSLIHLRKRSRIALDLASCSRKLTRRFFATHRGSFKLCSETCAFQIQSLDRIFQIEPEISEALGDGDLGQHPLAKLIDFTLGVTQTSEFVLVRRFASEKIGLLASELALKLLQTRRLPLCFGIQRCETFIERLLVAVEFSDSRSQLADLLLFERAAIAGPICFQFDGGGSFAQTRQVVL